MSSLMSSRAYKNLNRRPTNAKRQLYLRPRIAKYPLEIATLEAIAMRRYLTVHQIRVALFLQGHLTRKTQAYKLIRPLWENEVLDHPLFQLDLKTYHDFTHNIYALGKVAAGEMAKAGCDVSAVPARPDKANQVKLPTGGHVLMGNQYELSFRLALHHQSTLTLNYLVPEQTEDGTTGISWHETFYFPGVGERQFTFKVHPDYWQAFSLKRSSAIVAVEIDNNTERGPEMTTKLKSLNRLMELANMAKANETRPARGLPRHEIPAKVLAFLEKWDLIHRPWYVLFVVPTEQRREALMGSLQSLSEYKRTFPKLHHVNRFLFLAQSAYSSEEPKRSRVRHVNAGGDVMWPPPTFHGYTRILGHHLFCLDSKRPMSFKRLLQAIGRTRRRAHAPLYRVSKQLPLINV